MIPDNDQLAAELCIALRANLLVLLSNVDGVFSGLPEDPTSRLIRNYYVSGRRHEVQFWEKSAVGLGGMKSKLMAAEMAVKEGNTAVVIANGTRQGETILDVIRGRPLGTFITSSGETELAESPDVMAEMGESERSYYLYSDHHWGRRLFSQSAIPWDLG